jgi:hypothetical protein
MTTPRLSLRNWHSTAGDAGNAVIEAAILAPVFIVFLAALLVAARIRGAGAAVAQAAADAARQASIARTPAQARTVAKASALATLREKGLHCTPRITLDLAAFSLTVGRSGTITAQVSCTVTLADVAAPGMPGSRTVTKLHRSVLDPFRAKDPGDWP